MKVKTERQEEYHRVHIYKGTVLHELTVKEEIREIGPVISLSKEELYQLSVKRYQGQEKLLNQIEEYVVDTSQYKNFNLIEPITQLRQTEAEETDGQKVRVCRF